MDASTPLLCFSRLTEWFHLRYNCCNVSYTLLEIIYQEAIMSFFNLDSPVMRFLTKVADFKYPVSDLLYSDRNDRSCIHRTLYRHNEIRAR